ncbi:MAG TPA: toll/interleukin-1 receptor domain-containing protein [Thermoanaerobaculia bacterium]|jgi:hypothetical protein|nr:toll/interleukin-1 receptor domain-containing protein [Thermoanaerobaculia bacterium]
MTFRRGDEQFSIPVPYSDAVEFSAYINSVRDRTEAHELHRTCAAAVAGVPAAITTLDRISRRVELIETDAFLGRFWEAAINDDLAVAVGASLAPAASLPNVGVQINERLKVGWHARDENDYFEKWDEFVEKAEKRRGRQAVHDAVAALLANVKVTDAHRSIARLPITNFIDATLDRSLTKALLEVGKIPIVHDEMSMRVGEWEVAEVGRPHVFYVIGTARAATGFTGGLKSLLASDTTRVENIAEMLERRDLLLLDFAPWEAECVLRLRTFSMAAVKVANCAPGDRQPDYWARRGVYMCPLSPQQFVDGLLPVLGQRYGDLDLLEPEGKLIELARKKPYDVFISYSRQDGALVDRLSRGLRRRSVKVWRDEHRMRAGNPVRKTIEDAIGGCHSFAVVLTEHAVKSDWVRREIDEALNVRDQGEIEILPLRCGDCELPDALADFHCLDFRLDAAFEDRVTEMTRALRDHTARAARKLR